MRFTGINKGRVSVAVNNNQVESPARLDPNKVMLREKAGAADHGQEEAFRRENYEMLKKNLEEAFVKYDRDQNMGLDRDEFFKFMSERAQMVGMEISPEYIDNIFQEMDVDGNQEIDQTEFTELLFKTFKNCEDNIEFLSEDIKTMDEKIREVETKLGQLKQRDTNYSV